MKFSLKQKSQGVVMHIAEVVGEVDVVMQIHNSVAYVELVGDVTPKSLGLVKAAVIAALAEAGRVIGFVVNFSRADVLCTASELTAIFDGEGPADQSTVPAAMVVTSDQVPLFKAHVWECAWRGVVRQAFTERAPAIAWLTERAEAAAQTRVGR